MTLTKEYQLIKSAWLGNNGYGDVYVALYAKYNSQNVANNTSNVSIQARIITYGGYWWSNSGTTYRITGSGSIDSGSISCNGQYNVGETVLGTQTKDIKHNDNGTLTIWASANFASQPWGWNNTATDESMVLPTIPRYFSSKPTLTLKSKTETSLTFNWTTPETCRRVQYKINNGGWVTINNDANSTSGSFTISDLSHYTNYTVYGDFERRDSYLWASAGPGTPNVSTTTYDYPYCTDTPNFTIGDVLTLSLYNPLNRAVDVVFIGANGETLSTDRTSNTSISGYTGTNFQQLLYNTIPESKEGAYKIQVKYGSSTRERNNGNKYRINESKCIPNFSNFDYWTNLSGLTGDNDTVILGETTTTVNIPSSSRATGVNGAKIKSYRIECGIRRTNLSYSESTIQTTLSLCPSDVLKVTAIDTRGLEKTVTKTIGRKIEYVRPSFSAISAERKNGVEVESYLSAEMVFWNGNFGNGNNKITSLRYRTIRISDLSYSNWSNYIDLSNLSYSGNRVTLEDLLIHADTSSGGFPIGVAYYVQIEIKDGIDSHQLSTIYGPYATLTDGKVGFSMLKDGNGDYHLGINGMPRTDSKMTLNNVPIEEEFAYIGPSFPSNRKEKFFLQTSPNIFKPYMYYSGANGYYNNSTGIFTQSSSDTSTIYNFKIQGWDENWNYLGLLANNEQIYSPQKVKFTFTASSNLKYIQFGLNGATIDTLMVLDAYHLRKDIPITLSFEVTSLVQGSISWKNVQLEYGRTATAYTATNGFDKIWIKNENGIFQEFSTVQEGTWTPRIGALDESDPTASYSERHGYWMRMGKLVYIEFYMRFQISALNGSNNYACVKGMPFRKADGIAFSQNPLAVGEIYNCIVDTTQNTFCVTGNIIQVQSNRGAGASTLKTSGGTNSWLAGAGWFRVEN